MKSTYWLVIACCAGSAVMLWLAMLSVRLSARRRLARGEPPLTKRSMWACDLFDNPIGHALCRFIVPPLSVGWGLVGVLTGEARWRRFDYHGFDAVCIGLGAISIGVILLATYTFPARDSKGDKPRSLIVLAGILVFVASFATALFRNI